MYLIGRERLWLVGARQAYLSSMNQASRLSSRVVLFLAVPDEAALPENLQRTFCDKAQQLWTVYDKS